MFSRRFPAARITGSSYCRFVIGLQTATAPVALGPKWQFCNTFIVLSQSGLEHFINACLIVILTTPHLNWVYAKKDSCDGRRIELCVCMFLDITPRQN